MQYKMVFKVEDFILKILYSLISIDQFKNFVLFDKYWPI